MARSKIRTNDLSKVFRNGDSRLLNEIGALCILFEDFRHEVNSLKKFRLESGDSSIDVRWLHEMLYYVRRSLVTVGEVRDRLDAICMTREYGAYKNQNENNNLFVIEDARVFLRANRILKNLRNSLGAHIDPDDVVRAAIRYYGPNAISSIRWSDTETDFALELDFATHLLQGAIASHLPGGIVELQDEMSHFFLDVMPEAYKHLQDATFVLIHTFLWDRFATV